MHEMENTKMHLSELENEIGYEFKDKEKLVLALRHSSYANENRHEKLESNERIEFLGDAVLNIVVSEKIFTRYKSLAEGDMTKARANIVCEPSLMKCANHIKLGDYLLLGKGEELTGGRKRVSILSDAFEALIGAIYMDGGLEPARNFILSQLGKMMEDSVNGVIMMDYKTSLQEIVQKDNDKKVVYELIDEKGPDHSKIFVTQVKISEQIAGVGEGRSKKESEQNAAKSALDGLKLS